MKSGRLLDLFSAKMIKKLWVIPVSAIKIENFIDFLLTYAGLKQSINKVIFRNGIVIQTGDDIDCATISVIFLSKDYGNIPKNSTIIDIGANIGVFSLYCSKSNSTIYAFEPVPVNFDLLVKNIESNHLENKIIPKNQGVCRTDEKREIYLAKTSQFHSLFSEDTRGNKIIIDCVSLTTIFEKNHIDRCDILKIDCEGAEYEIFYLSPPNIIKRIQEIRMEYHNIDHEENNIDELIKFFSVNGFVVTKLRKDSLTSGIAWFKQK